MAANNENNEKGVPGLEQSLLANLDARGLTEPVFQDMVTQYMDLWRHRQMVRADIDTRGVSVLDTKRGVMVENKSVALEVQLSRQMMTIFTALGFRKMAMDTGPALYDDEEL